MPLYEQSLQLAQEQGLEAAKRAAASKASREPWLLQAVHGVEARQRSCIDQKLA